MSGECPCVRAGVHSSNGLRHGERMLGVHLVDLGAERFAMEEQEFGIQHASRGEARFGTLTGMREGEDEGGLLSQEPGAPHSESLVLFGALSQDKPSIPYARLAGGLGPAEEA